MNVQPSVDPGVSAPAVADQSIITFPDGIPGLGESRYFHILQLDDVAPIMLLQDCEDEHVSIPMVPVELVDPGYKLSMSDEDRGVIGVEPGSDDRSGLLCLSVLILPGSDHPPTCNLLAPIVVNTRTRLAKQVIQVESDYPSVFPLNTV